MKDLQHALIYGTFLYGAELSWSGTKEEERDVQPLTNWMGRAFLGVRRTTPVGIVAAESTLPPARALLDHRQASFALRLLARPRGGGGQEEVSEKRGNGLTARVRERCGLGRRESAEVQVWEKFKTLRARVSVEKKEDALRTAREWSDQEGTVWADSSRLECGAVGAAFTFKEGDRWVRRGTYLGKHKEVLIQKCTPSCRQSTS